MLRLTQDITMSRLDFWARICVAVAIILIASGPVAAQTEVANPDVLKAAVDNANPGDEIVVKNGSYQDWSIRIARSGTSSAPIVLRAESPGKVVFNGDSRLQLLGDYITVSGFCFRDGQASGEIWQMSGSHQRITDCAIIDYKDGGRKWIRIGAGRENRLDHNYVSGKTERDVTLQIDVSESADLNHHRIDHNCFGPRTRGSGNWWETIRNGYSHQQNNPAFNLFEFNLFHECDGENEIISSKSSHNTYRYNTFRNCAGELTLRHGKHNLVQGNFFFGEGKQGSAGIRVIGEGHVVVNNYIDHTRGIGIQLYEGDQNAQATGYQAANDVLVAFNTIVNNGGNGINVRDSKHSPHNNVIANNLLVSNARAISGLSPLQLSESYTLLGNMAFDNPFDALLPNGAIRTADPRLSRDARGVLRPARDGSVIGAAASSYGDFGFQVSTDLDGQGRPAIKDVGADQVDGTGDTVNRPLDVADIGTLIGPNWMAASENDRPQRSK